MPGTDAIREIATLLQKAPAGVLATISSVRGSSPAPVLSRMLVTALGETTGTVGGGCLEADVVREARRVGVDGGWRRVAYTLNESEEDLRMMCGGTVEVLLEGVTREDEPMFRLLAARHAAGQATLLARAFAAGGAEEDRVPGPAGTRLLAAGAAPPARRLIGEEGETLWGGGTLPEVARAAALRAIDEGRAVWLDDGRLFLEPVLGLPRVVLFGGGHVARAVARIAGEAGFRVTVIDDRPKYASSDRFPGAECVVLPGFQEIAARVPIVPRDYVLVMTRGHQYDEEILDQVLRLPPTRFLGVIGSRRKHLAAEERLTTRGIDPERFRDIRGPVGLAIGALTPEEIAISIVAQMIATRRGGPLASERSADERAASARPLTPERAAREHGAHGGMGSA